MPEGDAAENAKKEAQKLLNNLINMRSSDDVYEFDSARILRYLGKDAQILFESVKQIPIISTDIFYSFYSIDPLLIPKNDDALLEAVRKMMQNYMSGKDYQDIRRETKLDEEKSMAVTVNLVNQLLKQMQQAMQQQYKDGNPMDGNGQGLREMMDKAADNDRSAKGEIERLFREMMKKMGKKGFKEMMQKAMDEAAAQGTDMGRGTAQEQFSPQPLNTLDVHDINKILATTKRLLQSIPKFSEDGKTHSPLGDRIAGYTITKKPDKAITKEQAMPDDIFFSKMSEGWLTLDKYTVQEGAYYVLIDKSGSMSGQKTIWARSVALALYEQASRRNKKFFLRFFDDEPTKMVDKPKDIADAILRVNSSNGTNIDKALAMAVVDLMSNKKYSKQTNTIILITDGEDNMARDWVAELKKANCRVIAIMIQGNSEAIKKFADMYFSVEPTEDNAIAILKSMRRKEEKAKSTN